MTRRLGWAWLALAIASPSVALAAPDDLGPLLAPIREEHGVPALAGAIVTRDGTLVGLGAVGVRKEGAVAAVTTDDRWHLGSCTKAMTATLTGVLVERGSLSWETPLAEGFPDLVQTMPEPVRAVTVAQLLTHRSGLRPLTPLDLFALRTAPGDVREQRQGFVAKLLGEPLAHAPGETFAYNNLGYVVVGALLERLSGRSWEELIRAELFRPLGMTTAGFGPPGEPGGVTQPWGHRELPGNRFPVQFDNPAALGPAGTVHASLADWARFVAFHLGHEPGALGLSAATWERLHTPVGEYALGWGVARRGWSRGPILTHAGSNTFWYCVVWAALDEGFAVLVTTNLGTPAAAKACDQAAGALIQRFQRGG